MSRDEQAVLKQLQEAVPDIAVSYSAVQDLLRMMRQRNTDHFEAWIEKAKSSQVTDLVNFAVGVERDKEAVAGGLSDEWNNGQLEGQANRLKLLKRSMYGRANFDLLRLRVLHRD